MNPNTTSLFLEQTIDEDHARCGPVEAAADSEQLSAVITEATGPRLGHSEILLQAGERTNDFTASGLN